MLAATALAAALAAPGAAADAPQPVAPCAKANALVRLDRVDLAVLAYLEDLGTKRARACAIAGLANIGTERSCVDAQFLELHGFEDEAKAVYLRRLAADPADPCATEGLARVSSQSFWVWLGQAADDLVKGLEFVAAGLGALLVVLLALVTVQSRINWLRLRDRRPARWFVKWTVAIEPFDSSALDKQLGVATAGLVKGWIAGAPKGKALVEVLPGSTMAAEGFTSRLGALGDQAKIVAAFIDLVLITLPARDFKATGELQAVGPSGPGLTLALEKGGELIGTATFWAVRLLLPTDEDDVVQTSQRIAVPAAAWISHLASGGAGAEPDATHDPISWALFHTGLEWHRDGERAKAEKLYLRACLLDPRNYLALGNLGLLQLDQGRYGEAEQTFLAALKAMG